MAYATIRMVCLTALLAALGTVHAGAAEPPPGALQGAKRALANLRLAHISPPMSMGYYLDRLMMSESGGNDDAKNPMSSALGPYQFITSTWLDIVNRHFPDEVRDLTRDEVLALRTDRRIARKAAEVYSRENAELLAGSGVAPSFAHLRLAFLIGGSAAVKVLQAKPEDAVATLLEPAALRANPFLYGMTVSDLVARAERDLRHSGRWRVSVGKGAKKERLGIKVRCNLARPSCRKWLALKKRQLKRQPAKTAAAP
jgi:hypothetical protein